MKIQWMFFAILLTLGACKKDEGIPDPDPEPSVIIPETTIVIDDEYSDLVIDHDSTSMVLPKSPLTDSLKTGDILVSGINETFPEGILVKVTEISSQGDDILLLTERASLAEAIEKGSIRYEETFTPDDTLRTDLFDLSLSAIVFDADGDLSTTDDQIDLEGNLSTDLDIIFDMDFDFLSLEYFKAGFEMNDELSLTLSADVKKDFLEYDKAVYSFNFAPINIQVGVIPVVIFPAFVVRVGYEGAVDAEISFTADRTAYLNAAVIYENDTWTNNLAPVTSYEIIDPNISGECSLEFYAKAGLEFYFYGYKEISSSITLKPEIKAEASCNTNTFECDYAVSAGAEVYANIKATILDRGLINYTNTLVTIDIPITSGTTNQTSGTFEDERDGKEYGWVKIGDQVWMSENLRYDSPNSVCYEDIASNCDQYGRLYLYSEIDDICPDQWRMPVNADFYELINFAGGESDAGTKLKSVNLNGTDEYKFRADESAVQNQFGWIPPNGYSIYLSSEYNETFEGSPFLYMEVDSTSAIVVGDDEYGFNNSDPYFKTTCRCIKE